MSSETVISFAQLGLAEPVLQAVSDVGYEAPSPIQAESIPPLLAGRDLLGQAQTGTGKTAAFALPLLSRIDLSVHKPQILVLTPTRELAIQVAEAMQTYARHMKGFHILPIYGGQGMGAQLHMLKRGVHAVVGTPGRIQDHLRRRTLDLGNLSAVVLDEADEMLRMGFIDDVEQILSHTPPERQVALFSATMPAPIRRIADGYLRDPAEIRIKAKTATVSTIEQFYWQVSGTHKLDALTRILEVADFDGMIIFVRTKVATEELAEKLEARGFASAALNGDMNQAVREKTVERLKRGQLDIIVATDVAARGLDVERISHVVNYDIPYDTEAYVHRIGRTGRAGRKGTAILFVAPRERRMLYSIEKATRQPITPMQLPTRETIADVRIERFKQLITTAVESEELGFFEEIVEEYQQEHDLGLAEIAAALAFLVQRDNPLLPPGEKESKKRERADRPDARAPEPAERREPPPAKARRPDQRPAPEKRAPTHEDDEPMPELETYRVEVGLDHGVQPKNIVGAIANEAGLDSRFIGQVQLFGDHSLVDLPVGMPKDVFKHLKKVWVCGRQLWIKRLATDGDKPRDTARPSRPDRKTPPSNDSRAPKREKATAGKPKKAATKRKVGAKTSDPKKKPTKKFARKPGKT